MNKLGIVINTKADFLDAQPRPLNVIIDGIIKNENKRLSELVWEMDTVLF